MGFGGGLSWGMNLRLDSGLEVTLDVTNLGSVVYFDGLQIDNGKADGRDIPVGAGCAWPGGRVSVLLNRQVMGLTLSFGPGTGSPAMF